jgi:hypothetical protein
MYFTGTHAVVALSWYGMCTRCTSGCCCKLYAADMDRAGIVGITTSTPCNVLACCDAGSAACTWLLQLRMAAAGWPWATTCELLVLLFCLLASFECCYFVLVLIWLQVSQTRPAAGIVELMMDQLIYCLRHFATGV